MTLMAARPQSAQTPSLVQPGIGVGNISIGALRDKVRRLAGEPISSLEDGDQFSGFSVHYEDDRVVEIVVVAPRYHTAGGVSVKSTAGQFLKAYPKSKVTCYMETGASSVTTGVVYDEIEKGIALDHQVFEGRSREVINTLSVHRTNVPAKIYGEVTPCKK
jgi:hypothetical protein